MCAVAQRTKFCRWPLSMNPRLRATNTPRRVRSSTSPDASMTPFTSCQVTDRVVPPWRPWIPVSVNSISHGVVPIARPARDRIGTTVS
jgi:hypothetical protein